ncbi:MAG: DMT family transporter [Novosphingobium sp.]|nr:DMT family transporter [Novosphingobium sp.]MCP5401454.1 DMT family transporter [Novosphingobium sp.]
MERGAQPEAGTAHGWAWRHLLALLAANVALAIGPMLVRLADSGPVAAGFWRLFLSVPVLFALAAANHQKIRGFPAALWAAVAGAGLFFALDLASWHVGIGLTRLGNVTLLGNSGSLILMAWGIVALRRLPFRNELLALGAALVGAAILLGRSLEIGRETLAGDLFCLLAGFFYAFYLILAQSARVKLGNWSLLAWSSLVGSPVLLGVALALGEPVWPTVWWPVVTLALSSQIFGQGLLVYSLRHFPPLVIGLSLLTQPGIAVLVGWFAFDETLTWLDGLGMALVAGALVLARAAERR